MKMAFPSEKYTSRFAYGLIYRARFPRDASIFPALDARLIVILLHKTYEQFVSMLDT